mmetsp:Transcript_19615/g.43755  ORF Transcript_19615/g.43755 Transcript_19615/m.43755 type:complete len:259 (-) Transcript_19615:232-1008(-)
MAFFVCLTWLPSSFSMLSIWSCRLSPRFTKSSTLLVSASIFMPALDSSSLVSHRVCVNVANSSFFDAEFSTSASCLSFITSNPPSPSTSPWFTICLSRITCSAVRAFFSITCSRTSISCTSTSFRAISAKCNSLSPVHCLVVARVFCSVSSSVLVCALSLLVSSKIFCCSCLRFSFRASSSSGLRISASVLIAPTSSSSPCPRSRCLLKSVVSLLVTACSLLFTSRFISSARSFLSSAARKASISLDASSSSSRFGSW